MNSIINTAQRNANGTDILHYTDLRGRSGRSSVGIHGFFYQQKFIIILVWFFNHSIVEVLKHEPFVNSPLIIYNFQLWNVKK